MSEFLDTDIALTDAKPAHPKPGPIDIMRLLKVILGNFHWILLSTLIGFFVARTWLRYQVPVYRVAASMSFDNLEVSSAANNILKIAGIADDKPIIQVANEIQILTSFDLLSNVVDSLHLQLQFASDGRIKQQPFYPQNLPVEVSGRFSPSLSAHSYKIEVLPAKVVITMPNGNVATVNYNALTPLPTGDTLLFTKKQDNIAVRKFILRVLTQAEAVKELQAKLSIVPANESPNMIRLSITDDVPQESIAIINTLIHFYDVASIDYKNKAIRKAQQFLVRRIDEVLVEIDSINNVIADFRVRNKLLEPLAEASNSLTQMRSLEQQVVADALRDTILADVEKQLLTVTDVRKKIVANPLSVQDGVLGGLFNQYNGLLFNRIRIEENGTPDDPTLPLLERQMKEVRENILKNIQIIRLNYKRQKDMVGSESRKFETRFNSLPIIDQELQKIRRQLGLKEGIFQTLLQKKEDVGVQLASANINSARLIDIPRNTGNVAPDVKKVQVVGVAVGVVLPILIIFLAVFLNKRVESRSDIENSTLYPVIGEISEVDTGSIIHVLTHGKDLVSEQYRLLRSNLQFMGTGKQDGQAQVILVTSFMRDEGKSFSSLNVAGIFAQTGKKVCLLEFDLRRPKLSKALQRPNLTGIANYVIGDKQLEDIIQPITQYNNLHFIASGPLAPNPAEMLLSPKMEEMFAYLKTQYDYIILDSAPIGLVSDTFSLTKYVDTTLYVIRHKLSLKPSIQFMNEMADEAKLRNVGIIVNGIKSSKFLYGYGYKYGYYYSYVYGNDETEATAGSGFFTKWFRSK
ncbi:MAG: polysaccharide biosynthesis tyrosine autokinase [Bacteroidetes bacterium]|nr:MAG: polysaccharide biosynthesis tyrosine autokinase [Bacteroidota bacterium]TAF97780.1 MAG: polysaccharide biosynthesis tyrosine autokinase [Bacteroidota bacterium]